MENVDVYWGDDPVGKFNNWQLDISYKCIEDSSEKIITSQIFPSLNDETLKCSIYEIIFFLRTLYSFFIAQFY